MAVELHAGAAVERRGVRARELRARSRGKRATAARGGGRKPRVEIDDQSDRFSRPINQQRPHVNCASYPPSKLARQRIQSSFIFGIREKSDDGGGGGG